MADQGLNALLLFKQESMFYLTGYDNRRLLALPVPHPARRQRHCAGDPFSQPPAGGLHVGHPRCPHPGRRRRGG
ncbi:MAG: aminopeptidase P family N-terminal domain-containing protein [Rhodospirillales bacterium]|nr:aminopeptidase P family N-terminal domain-containing protein [Rhodospirillales bacterium]